MSNCQWCGDSFNHLPNCPVIEVNTLKARVAELDAEKRVSASEIEYLNSMNRIWKASGLMVIVIALLLRIIMFKLPPYDKCLHAIGGQIIALVTLPMGIPWSIGIVLVVAIGKEIWDRYHPDHTCDVWDAVATVSGGLPVWGLYLVYHLR